MSQNKFFAVALCAISVTASAYAARKDTNSLEAVIKKVQSQQKVTSTLEADFRQEKSMALLSSPEVSTGHFSYEKPNNVLWSYDAPKRVQMLIANGFLTTYYPELKKAERIEVKRYQDRIFKYMGATGAIEELSNFFDFTFSNRADQPSYVLDLTPKSKTIAKRVQHIKIWIDKKTYLTNKFEYTEGDGDKTLYEFTNIRVNQPVSQTRFELSLPANVRVEQMKIQ